MMRRLNPLIAVLAALVVPLGGLFLAGPAMAYNVSAIYKQCENAGQLTGHFSRAELQAALNGLPSEVSEYSDCQDLIHQALLRASSPGGGHHNGSGTGGGGGGGSSRGGGSGKGSGGGHTSNAAGRSGKSGSPSTGSGQGVTLAGSNIRPGATGATSTSSLPTALVVVLVLLALTAVSGGAVAIRRRVVARHST